MISQYLQPQRISVFMPQRMSDEDIELLFVVREDMLEALLRSLNNENPDSIPQHHLLIGQRGMGKTTLLKRLDIELRKPSYKQRFIPFTFPEEQYNIDRLSKFWLNSLDALADTVQTQGDVATAHKLDDQISALSSIRDEQELSNNAYTLLKQTANELGRRPVFLLDNLNLIFDRLGEAEQSRLRKLISEPGAPVFIGASATPFDNNLEYNAPFYDAFDVHYLSKLDFDQTLLILRHLAQITNQEELQNQLNENNTSRLQTLHALTGGNVRTVVILFSLVAQGFSADVFLDLEALIDQMTPLYKARFEELAKQSQVVIDAVALNWDPSDLETLREKTLLENNQLSVQLDRLLKSGWINRLGKRKAATYEVSERFFNVWYLMRRSSRRQRRDLLWLTRFLQAWFTSSELQKRAEDYARIVSDKCHPHEISFGLALARASKNEKTSSKLLETTYKRLIELYEADAEKIEQLSGVDPFELKSEWLFTYKSQKSKDQVAKAFNLIQNNQYVEAESAWKRAIELDQNNAWLWVGLGDLYQYGLKRYSEAEQTYKRAIDLDPNDVRPWIGLGKLNCCHLHHYAEAEQAYQRATQLDSTQARSWHGLGHLYHVHLDQYPEAEQAYRRAIELDGNDALSWTDLADLYQYGLKHYSEAEQAYQRVIGLNPDDARPWTKLADLYRIRLGRYPEAEQTYKRAIGLDPNDFRLWGSLGLLYQYDLKCYSEAEQAYKRAIELDPNDARPWIDLGNLYHYDLNRYAEAEQAYKRAIELDPVDGRPWIGLGKLNCCSLHQYNEAEQAYKQAIKLDSAQIQPWQELGHLYHVHLNRYAEAEQAYKRAIELDPNDARPWIDLGNLYHYDLNRYAEAEQAYKRAIELDPVDGRPWINLGNLYHIHLNQYLEAEQAYKRAIELDHNSVLPWVGLGLLYQYNFSRYPEAEQAYKQAVELDQNNAWSWDNLGDLYQYSLNRYAEAEQAYKRAIELDPNDAQPWMALGNLYSIKLSRYTEAEQSYKRAIELNQADDFSLWNRLGNLLMDHLGKYTEAKEAFERVLQTQNDSSIFAKANLIFLLRDQLNDYQAAKQLLESLRHEYVDGNVEDTFVLHEATFAAYDKNWGLASGYWSKALGLVGDSLPSHTSDDWYRSAAVAVRLNYGQDLLAVFESTGHNRIFRPLYEALKALTLKNPEEYLANEVAAEVRDVALQILQFMRKYNRATP